MSLNIYFSDLILRSINSGFSFFVIGVIVTIIYFLSRGKFDSVRQKSKFKYRLIYIAVFVYLLVLVRIWIEGFTHLFTMLSLVAAGLVVANKESIMNITGWFIINWRGLFSSGDAVQVQNITGYVVSVKLLYFKIHETTSLGNKRVTGKVIKLPNSLIISNPVIIFTSDDFFMLHQVNFTLKQDSDLQKIASKMMKFTKKLINDQYSSDLFKAKKGPSSWKHLSGMIDANPTYDFEQLPQKLDVLSFNVSFYCFPDDYQMLKNNLIACFKDACFSIEKK